MTKKQALAAMEGKHHDAKPPYSRKVPLTVHGAAAEAEEVKSWTCKSCDKMVEQEGVYCRSCAQYWTDLAGGLFDDHY